MSGGSRFRDSVLGCLILGAYGASVLATVVCLFVGLIFWDMAWVLGGVVSSWVSWALAELYKFNLGGSE